MEYAEGKANELDDLRDFVRANERGLRNVEEQLRWIHLILEPYPGKRSELHECSSG